MSVREEHDDGRFRLVAGEYMVLALRQAGGRIPLPVVQGLFEPFAHRHKGAMGLAPAYGILQQAQGALYVENDETGACFSLFLPRADLPAAAAA